MYFPSTSVSMFSLSPTFFVLKFVIFIVCGIIHTEPRSFFASTTVRLIPSNAIEPFCTIYFVWMILRFFFFSMQFFEIF